MAELKLIHGRQSIKYDHFRELDFSSCRALDTRLMGVTALKVTWRSRTDRRARFYQIIHLDYSEYGVDEYQEFDCMPGTEEYAERKEEMTGLWNRFISTMGGEVLSLDAPCMMRLIETALPLASEGREREYDSEDNAAFRRYALMRIGYMMDALRAAGFSSSGCSEEEAIDAVSPLRRTAYETINYFVMRLVDRDFAAAAYLSSLSREMLADSELAAAGVQTLVKCSIDRSSRRRYPPVDGNSFPFSCRITTLGRDSYYHCTFVIWLNGNYRSKNPVVTEIKTGSVLKLSDYEAALQIRHTEFLTVFDCKDSMLEGFDPKYIGPLASSAQSAVPNGWLYTIYNKDNSHVDRPEYRLSDDVFGYALLSIGGQLVLMSHELRSISILDDSTIFSLYSPFIETKGRYRIDSPVFQTLCQAPGALFEDLVEPGEE